MAARAAIRSVASAVVRQGTLATVGICCQPSVVIGCLTVDVTPITGPVAMRAGTLCWVSADLLHLLHQQLSAGLDWLLPVPSCFRAVDAWLEFVRQGVLDGALWRLSWTLCWCPTGGLALGLQTALAAQGLPLKPVGSNCVTAPHWPERLVRGRYAMPISAGAQRCDPWAMGLELRQLPEGLHSPVWPMLPRLEGHQWLPERALEQLWSHPSLVH